MLEITHAERLDEQADVVGTRLAEVEENLRLLFGELNFLDVSEDQQDELETNLRRLAQVRDLVTIAVELYPYPYGDDRQ